MFKSVICLYVCAAYTLILCSNANALDDYEVPPAIIKPLEPRGLQVSIPDHEGVTLFAFHGNVNEDFENGREAGQMAVDVLRKRNGYWTYTNRVVRLKKGDIVYYWLYVIKNGLGYERLFQSFEVNEFYKENEIILPSITTTAKPEDPSILTTIITEIPTTKIPPTTVIPPAPIATNIPPAPETSNIPFTPPKEVRPNPHPTNMQEVTPDDKIYFPTNPPPRRKTTELIDVREKDDSSCVESITTVKEKKVCKGDLIFSSDFSNGIGRNWSHEIHFNTDESEFVVFDNNPSNSFTESNRLIIKPTILDDHYGQNFTLRGPLDLTLKCTSDMEQLCTREITSFTILPPIMSARLTTADRFSFRYGIVEIRAKLPTGDWVIPEIWLQPKHFPYGIRNGGKIVLAKSIGNSQLAVGEQSIGSNLLTSALQVHDKVKIFNKLKNTGLWTDEFHVFKLQWTKTKMTFYVDGEVMGDWDGTNPRFLEEYEQLSPFDQEFYITLGIHVGDYGDIPDEALSNGRKKPWKNFEVRRLKKFYDDIKAGGTSWSDETKMQVDYIKVWAL
nr:beta-1,3-glucan-binding protein 1 [Sogatella furcifera]